MSTWSFPFCPQPPAWLLDWPALEAGFAWLKPLGSTPQNPVWHAEGDVLTHTRMVLEVLCADPRWRAMPSVDRSILFAAALLHDIGKQTTTREEGGQIVSPKHTRVGQQIARRLLWTGAAGPAPDFAARETVAALVRYHGLPVLFIERPDPARAVAIASLRLRCDHLALLSEADVRGRICPDTSDFMDRIGLFREFCAEQGCLDAPKRFESDLHRFSYCTDGRDYHYVPYDDSRFDVTLMSGLPASGKSHWVRQSAGRRPVICLDDIRTELDTGPGEPQGAVVDAARERARTYMRQGQPFIWDATNITRQMRAQLVSLFASYKGRVRITYVECPHDEMRRRNQARPSPVPTEVIDRMVAKLEVPTPEEAHQVMAEITQEPIR